MSKKQILLEKQIDKLNVLLTTMSDYISAFKNFPPNGEMARQEAILEFVHNTSDVIEKIKVIRRKQIEILEGESE